MAKVRLDKFISSTLVISRKDASLLIKSGRISVNGLSKVKADDKVDDNLDEVLFDGEKITFAENIYIMLNKPQGLISSTDDKSEKTVLSLFDKSYADKGLFPCGRLDKDTVGLLIMTTDGSLASVSSFNTFLHSLRSFGSIVLIRLIPAAEQIFSISTGSTGTFFNVYPVHGFC